MHKHNYNLFLPYLHALLPCCPSHEIVCIGGGRSPQTTWLAQLIRSDKKTGTSRPIWAIDRGVNICHRMALPPILLIGDGDSADNSAWRWAEEHGAQVHAFPPQKDFTDTQLALQIAAKQIEHPLVILTASFGGRLDHLMSIAAVAAHASIPCVLADEKESLFFLHNGESLTVTCEKPPRAISLLPFTEECTGVTTEGLYWELKETHLTNHSSLAISNIPAQESLENTFTVSIKTGVLGIYLCHIE